MRNIKTWEELIEELIENDYDLGENVIVIFKDKKFIYNNEEVNDYRKEYGEPVIESLHHPILEHLLERRFLKLL